jgi:hypothetical protein
MQITAWHHGQLAGLDGYARALSKNAFFLFPAPYISAHSERTLSSSTACNKYGIVESSVTLQSFLHEQKKSLRLHISPSRVSFGFSL